MKNHLITAESFETIQQMGFSAEAAASALAASGGRLQLAIDLLVSGTTDAATDGARGANAAARSDLSI